MREIIRALLAKSRVKFSELFSLKKKSVADVITGFLASLELAKLKKITLEQRKQFGEIYLNRVNPAGTHAVGQESMDNMAL